MKAIIFFDSEISADGDKILDIGAIKNNGEKFHLGKLKDFMAFIDGMPYLCGHNIIHHDLKYLHKKELFNTNKALEVIDTLYLSPLLFPTRPYHRLLKDDKLQTDELNNPLNDAIKARDLFHDEVQAFRRLDKGMKNIFASLLNPQLEFSGFFSYVDYPPMAPQHLATEILKRFDTEICNNAILDQFIQKNPIALAYVLALINCTDLYSITPPWVLHHYPQCQHIMHMLRSNNCGACAYCQSHLDIHRGLKAYFGFDSYRTFADIPLQENAVKAAVANQSLLAIFPTGGGKSLTFQIPALMAGRNSKGLTVVISPLQSLMKDQVDNLEKNGITQAVTINGMLDPIERSQSFQRVADGLASILYISPESLRSRSIEQLLLGRNIVRFVIDEAHCFSSWGQDFRVDYLYIAEFIKNLQLKKNTTQAIAVSCFTATAKQKVITDIVDYFQHHLNLELQVFAAKTARSNLQYEVFDTKDEHEKYNKLRQLIESNNCPTIIYVSRTRKAYNIAKRLCADGFDARPYHGKMDIQEKNHNQNAFIAGEIQIMVATSAFGMGVDKKDIGMVIHYDISDSLENYVQESGRAGRDENIRADCFVLFNEEDLHKHFVLLNQTKLSVKEIGQIWKAIKDLTRYRKQVSNSALEIARMAGWDDNVVEIETRVVTAITALEQAGYLKRGQNIPRIFANSILAKNAQQAIEKINRSSLFNKIQKVQAIRIIKKLFSSKSKYHANDETPEARIDYISDHLGIVTEQVIKIITLLREEEILADSKDLTAFIQKGQRLNLSLAIVKTFARIEVYLLAQLQEGENIYNIKQLNESALLNKCKNVTPQKIKTVINFWSIQNWIKTNPQRYSNNHIGIICQQDRGQLKKRLQKRHILAEFIVQYMFAKSINQPSKNNTKEQLVEFSVHELKQKQQQQNQLFQLTVTIEDIEDALFYLSRISAIKIEGGFLVVYNKLSIDRLQNNNKIQYKKEDYKQLEQFYQSKMQQIHIVGEYAKTLIRDYQAALTFVDDYFQLDYQKFLQKYFKGERRQQLNRNITPTKFKQLFAKLSPRQLRIINDKQSAKIVVAAGPGSGKTRVLVHKLASLLLMEDVKHEGLLMLTFSRAATTEFKTRLLQLIGNAANYIEIKTFHSYCFDLLGRVGNIEKSAEILPQTVNRINNNEIEINRISKSVLVIDEAQDMDKHEFALIQALMDNNPQLRIVAVGDDDQNIYTFRGADSRYFESLCQQKKAKKYELIENYRSKNNLVEYSNCFVKKIKTRFKSTSIVPNQLDNGDINIVHYRHNKLIVPIVQAIINSHYDGTIGVLTVTNEQALRVTGLLLQNQQPAQLIQANESFNLYNLVEIRVFLQDLATAYETAIIPQQDWKRANALFTKKFSHSSNYKLIKNLLAAFKDSNPKAQYWSDLLLLINESKIEDFITTDKEIISVSTIHKAKGKEFDHVFILLPDFKAQDDESKRQLYVAMTRAKKSLNIHTNGYFLKDVQVVDMHTIENTEEPAEPQQLLYHLTHKDIQLGYFDYIQGRIDKLSSGEQLFIDDMVLVNAHNQPVVKFSKGFQKVIEDHKLRGYLLSAAKINYMLYWQDKSNDLHKEVKILLPELRFDKCR
jgi:ATP-dependent DNA helicase RecQ